VSQDKKEQICVFNQVRAFSRALDIVETAGASSAKQVCNAFPSNWPGMKGLIAVPDEAERRFHG